MNWELSKYNNEWAIFCKTSRCYVAFGEKQKLIEKLKQVGFRWEQRANKLELEFQMKTNMAFAVALCRIKLWRDPAPLPKVGDIMAQAKYWKRIYNSEKGRGTVEHFCAMNGYRPEEKKEKK